MSGGAAIKQIIENENCPYCGGAVVTDGHGAWCLHRDGGDGHSCSFFVPALEPVTEDDIRWAKARLAGRTFL